MSKIKGRQSKSKLSRRCKVNIWGRANDAFESKPTLPGQHKTARRSTSNFAKQNTAKQHVKNYYSITDGKLRTVVRAAVASLKNSNEYIVYTLETMIASVVYRAGFASTIFLAKQLVSHGHVLLNGKRINISTANIKVGDKLQLTSKAASMKVVAEFIASKARQAPSYLEVSDSERSITLKFLPKYEDVPYESKLNIPYLLEFYSR